MPPKIAHQYSMKIRHGDHHQRRRRQVGTEALEDFLEGRNHEDHDHRGNDEGDDDDRHRIEQRRLDLGLDGDHFSL
jgi:hypothetical protein